MIKADMVNYDRDLYVTGFAKRGLIHAIINI